jgi:lysophospholipase L1-like esterase
MVKIRRGQSHLTTPKPPPLLPGETRVANLFVDYFSDGSNPDVFPLIESAARARTLSTPGRIPGTMAKIRSGASVKIVCWGDSVTAGGDASRPAVTSYPAVLQRRLKTRFPKVSIDVEVVAVGGSNSRQWLWPDRYPHKDAQRAKEIAWERIVAADPDLVTVEFVNDASRLRKRSDFDTAYAEIERRIKKLGAEIVFITPHFTMPEKMGFSGLREPESRPYVSHLIDFALLRGHALADASSRWAHLWREGIPYITLLNNGINHPDDRGHAIFADELMQCFD